MQFWIQKYYTILLIYVKNELAGRTKKGLHLKIVFFYVNILSINSVVYISKTFFFRDHYVFLGKIRFSPSRELVFDVNR